MDLSLRPWRPDDAASLAANANNPRIAEFLREGFPSPFTEEHARNYIRYFLESNPAEQLFFAVEVDGQAVGSVGIFRRDNVYRMGAEIAYWLGEPYWGRGLMSRTVTEGCRIAFSKLGVVRISAEPYAHNAGSRRVLEKAGFALEGMHRMSVFKNGKFYDSCTYALLQANHGAASEAGEQHAGQPSL